MINGRNINNNRQYAVYTEQDLVRNNLVLVFCEDLMTLMLCVNMMTDRTISVDVHSRAGPPYNIKEDFLMAKLKKH